MSQYSNHGPNPHRNGQANPSPAIVPVNNRYSLLADPYGDDTLAPNAQPAAVAPKAAPPAAVAPTVGGGSSSNAGRKAKEGDGRVSSAPQSVTGLPSYRSYQRDYDVEAGGGPFGAAPSRCKKRSKRQDCITLGAVFASLLSIPAIALPYAGEPSSLKDLLTAALVGAGGTAALGAGLGVLFRDANALKTITTGKAMGAAAVAAIGIALTTVFAHELADTNTDSADDTRQLTVLFSELTVLGVNLMWMGAGIFHKWWAQQSEEERYELRGDRGPRRGGLAPSPSNGRL